MHTSRRDTIPRSVRNIPPTPENRINPESMSPESNPRPPIYALSVPSIHHTLAHAHWTTTRSIPPCTPRLIKGKWAIIYDIQRGTSELAVIPRPRTSLAGAIKRRDELDTCCFWGLLHPSLHHVIPHRDYPSWLHQTCRPDWEKWQRIEQTQHARRQMKRSALWVNNTDAFWVTGNYGYAWHSG